MRRGGLLLLLLVLAAWDPVTRRQGDVAAGNKQLAAGKLSDAESHYRKALAALPGRPGVLFDLGAAHYAQAEALPKGEARAKLLDAAEKEFRLAGDAPETRLRASAHYNLGNALFREDKLKEAVEEYKKALKLDPGLDDARKNLELALVRIPPPPPPQKQPQQGKDDQQKQQPKPQQQQQQQQAQGQDKQDQQQPQQADPQREEQQQQAQQPEPQQPEQKPEQQQQASAKPAPGDDEDTERKLDALERRSSDLQIAKARERARERRRGKVVKDW